MGSVVSATKANRANKPRLKWRGTMGGGSYVECFEDSMDSTRFSLSMNPNGLASFSISWLCSSTEAERECSGLLVSFCEQVSEDICSIPKFRDQGSQ